MAGGEDSSVHETPASPVASNAPTATPPDPPKDQKELLPMQRTSEIMLGFALAIIFIVIFCVICHLLMKQHREKYPNGRPKKRKKKKMKDLEKGTVELHSVDRNVFEAGSTQVVLCELPEDAPPIHELDAGYDWPLSPLERTLTGTTRMTGSTTSENLISPVAMVSPAAPWPQDQPLAVYWQTR